MSYHPVHSSITHDEEDDDDREESLDDQEGYLLSDEELEEESIDYSDLGPHRQRLRGRDIPRQRHPHDREEHDNGSDVSLTSSNVSLNTSRPRSLASLFHSPNDNEHSSENFPATNDVVEDVEPTSFPLRKSRSIQEKLAVKAKEMVSEVDKVVRGIEEEQKEYVDDHVLETLDYDFHEDTMNEVAVEKKGKFLRNYLLVLKILLFVFVGFFTAMLMYLVDQGTSLFRGAKHTWTIDLITDSKAAGAFFSYLFMNLFYAGIAASLCAIVAPNSRGSGVPFAISYLNGTNVSEYFSPRIVLIKTVALIFTISASLPLGMEGPFVFIGGGVALICVHYIDTIIPCLFVTSKAAKAILTNIREERVIMAGGVAAGLAVAFDAPIAGVLFALEGATAFLSAPVLLRIFGCAMFASFFNDLQHTNFSSEVQNHNLIQITSETEPVDYLFQLPEILPFTIIAVIGGILGAGATWINIKVSKWRHHALQGNSWVAIGKQISEILCFTVVTSVTWFVLPYIFGCRDKHSQCASDSEDSTRCPQLQCSADQYSEIGSIVYATSDGIGRLLFDRSLEYENDFHTLPLLVFGFFYWIYISGIYGAFVPGGLFVPSIVIGGVYGRAFGVFIKFLFPNSNINPGVYALLGAASMLGGFTRLALPIVVMLIELTGDATYLLPIMYCGVLGKFVADFLYPALYPQHMALEGIPTLTDSLHPAIAKLHAKDIMIPAETIPTIQVIGRLSNIMRILQTSKRAIFPLVTSTGECAGLITRRSIMFAMPHLQSFATAEEAEKFPDKRMNDKGNSHPQEMLDWHASTLTWNETLTANSLSALADHYVNLLPFADTGTIAARAMTPTKRLAGLFRRLGCSHLCIVDRRNRFLGLVTRRGLIVPPSAPYNLPSSTLTSGSRIPPLTSTSSSLSLFHSSPQSTSSLSRVVARS